MNHAKDLSTIKLSDIESYSPEPISSGFGRGDPRVVLKMLIAVVFKRFGSDTLMYIFNL